jgi:hypothetical protein
VVRPAVSFDLADPDRIRDVVVVDRWNFDPNARILPFGKTQNDLNSILP